MSLEPPEVPNQQYRPNNNRRYPPKNWLTESILLTIFCCSPFGIIGIVQASKVDNLFYSGDAEGAERYAAEAKKWVSIGFGIAVGFMALSVILQVILPFLGMAAWFSVLLLNLGL